MGLKNNEATADNGIMAEMTEYWGDNMIPTQYESLTRSGGWKNYWKGEKCYHSTETQKRGQERYKQLQSRGIVLLEVGYKVLSRLLLNRVEGQLDSTVIRDCQVILGKDKVAQNRSSSWNN